ncbi:unnamed protein product [Closterium sp. NIES-53]
MSDHCSEFYENLYKGGDCNTPSTSFWDHIYPSTLPAPTCTRISAPISLSEVKAAMATLSRGKTPGHNGLAGNFYRTHYATLVPALHSLFSSIETNQSMPQSMLMGRTVLIPKKADATFVENLRPITLMISDYKILAIGLAKRLQLTLRRIIHPAQSAFIKGRRIGDTINDSLDPMEWAEAKKLPLVMLTVEIKKAFDMVDREFMYKCLAHLGTPPPFIAWVKLMHNGAYTQVLVNNLAGRPIPVLTGVRQGCPLAPLLFICVIEVLHRHLSVYLPGFTFAPAQRRLAACYADDMTLFLNSGEEVKAKMQHLQSFAEVSGEHANWAKCSIDLVNILAATLPPACPTPIRQPNEAERILGVYIQSDTPSATTWEKNLTKVRGTASLLAKLHATSTCRSALSSECLVSLFGYGGRFQPPPEKATKQLDMVVGNFLSASKYKEEGMAMRFIPDQIMYNSRKHGGFGAMKPSPYL